MEKFASSSKNHDNPGLTSLQVLTNQKGVVVLHETYWTCCARALGTSEGRRRPIAIQPHHPILDTYNTRPPAIGSAQGRGKHS